MHFSLTEEQRLIVDTTREFVANELFPHEAEVEATGRLRPELRDEIKRKAIGAGLYAANMPAEVGGAGLDTLTWILYERELGRANYALHWTCVGRPSNILMACEGDQRERYLLPAVRGERSECLAMTEPGAGSDLRGMKTRARQDGDDFVINGTKHFISHADEADFVVLFAATGEVSPRKPRPHHRVPDRPRYTGLPSARWLQKRLPPRLQQLHPAVRRLPRAEVAGAR
jgi:acyl-CoA dehydrogenase